MSIGIFVYLLGLLLFSSGSFSEETDQHQKGHPQSNGTSHGRSLHHGASNEVMAGMANVIGRFNFIVYERALLP